MNTESKLKKIEGFTPGPWYNSPQDTYVRAKGAHGWNIATIEDQEPYTKANAELIAYAPELYTYANSLEQECERLRGFLKEIQELPWNMNNIGTVTHIVNYAINGNTLDQMKENYHRRQMPMPKPRIDNNL